MYKKLSIAVVCSLVAFVPAVRAELDAQSVFDQLTTLAGTWQGVPEGVGEAATAEAEMSGELTHEFQMSAAGTVVMETMSPGTDREMINMYHIDGEDLVLTHYCAGGNQPSMRLDREKSTAEDWIFDFSGGTNLDPAVDEHIHAAQITLVDSDHLESVWTGYKAGNPAGKMKFHLTRSE